MKLEIGRICVLLNGEDAFNLYDPGEKPLLVKLIGFPDEDGVAPVLAIEDRDGLPLRQYVAVDGLKPATEKQRTLFNREYRKVVSDFNKKKREMYWL